MVSRWNSSGIFPRIQDVAAQWRSQKFIVEIGRRHHTGRILFMSMFNDMSCGTKNNETECLANAKVASLHARRFGKGQWSFIGLGSEKSGTQSVKMVHKQNVTQWRQGCYWNSLRADVQFSVLRLHCPEVNSKAKDMVNSRYILRPIWKRLRLSRRFVSANQLSLYGAVAEICEGYESLHERTGRPVVMGQSIVFSAIKTEVSLDCDDLANKDFLLQQYEEWMRSCHNKINWANSAWIQDFWMFLKSDSFSWRKTLQISHNFMQLLVVNTPFQEKIQHHNRKDGSKGNTKNGPAKKVATSYLHGKHGVEIRIIRDNTHSWVRISHGSNKFVMNLNNNGTDIPEDHVEYALQLNAKDFACQSKAKAKPQRREPAGSSPRIVPIGRRNWIDIEPGKYSFSGYEVSKKVTFLLRQSQQVHREEDGAVHFWRIKENLRSQFPQSLHWSDGRWKACLAAGGGDERYSNTALMLQEQLFISELFKDIQDAILLIHHYRTMW